MIKRPLYLNKIIPFINKPFIKILTGVRRSGKSTILRMIQDKLVEDFNVSSNFIHAYRFDSMEYIDMDSKKMYQELTSKIIEGKKNYFFLDEVQEINGWERVVNSLQEDFDVDIYVTGSNSKMMSSEISSYLTGRYVSFRVYTLSFEEYLNFKKEYSKEEIKPREEIFNYLKLGGFPGTHLYEMEQDNIYTIVKDIYNATIYSDIARRNDIRKIDQLERVVKYVFNNVGNTFSAATIGKYIKSENRTIDNETVYNYLEKLEKAYLIHRCSRYDLKGKEILKTQEKFYLADTSIRYAILGYNDNTVASSLENIVYLELLRRDYEVYIGKIDDKEVDFVATKQNKKIYVQVTQRIEQDKTFNREYNAFNGINDNYPKYVLRTDNFVGGNVNGIKSMHVADFLLDKDI